MGRALSGPRLIIVSEGLCVKTSLKLTADELRLPSATTSRRGVDAKQFESSVIKKRLVAYAVYSVATLRWSAS